MAAKEFLDAFAQKQKRIEAIKKAEQTITTAPNEPGANLTLGLYYCFTRGDEKKGLPMLAKGSDQKLSAAAKLRVQNLAKGVTATLEEADAWYDAAAGVSAENKGDVQRKAHDAYTLLASSGTGLEKVKAEKRRDELAAVVASLPEKKGTPRIRASDIPELSTGMVGRVFVNGKDAGVLVTFRPGRQLNPTLLRDILEKSKATSLRVVLEGFVSCTIPTNAYVFHGGESDGPGQIISIRGNQVSAVGGQTGRSNSNSPIQLPVGEHVVQWTFDFGGTTSPNMSMSVQNGGPLVIRYTRQQVVAARKAATTSEVDLSN